tara:strand:+ start:75 stop:299 length:225 start_codon:yes stop_codon:yes gene_type:complete
MAWVSIPNNSNWEYQNSPPDPGATSALRRLWLQQTGGIRTESTGSQIYTHVRKVGDANDANRGELSKSYWDAQS